MKISILVPTRKRVQNVKRLIESVYNTAQNIKNIELLFYVDDDDQDTIDLRRKKRKKDSRT